DRISLAGVLPLAPSFDTIGFFARDFKVLDRVANVLLPDQSERSSKDSRPTIHLVRELFDLTDPVARRALHDGVSSVGRGVGDGVRETSLTELCDDERAGDLNSWLMIYRVMLGAEIMSCHGGWFAAAKPEFGPAPSAGFEYVQQLDRTRINEWVALREH